MILLSSIIKQFESSYKTKYLPLPSQLAALNAMKNCRTSASPQLFAQCKDCDNNTLFPHSCGHRNCPHCQAHESQIWIENQLKRQVPANYFMVTFTLPSQLREITWRNQKLLYKLMFECAKNTLQTFTKNDKKLGGTAGLMSVLHTHARNLDYHPHIHIIIAAASINQKTKSWKTKNGKYLFNHKALAKVFKGKILSRLTELNIKSPSVNNKWIVDCKYVGKGNKAIVYLGRYLYRGVIREKDIISCKDGKVTYRYQNSKTKKYNYKTVTGEHFLYLMMQHILPKGFRRARNYGFVHPNCKRMIALIHYLLKFKPLKYVAKPRPPILCRCCGAVMKIVRTRIKKSQVFDCIPIKKMEVSVM